MEIDCKQSAILTSPNAKELAVSEYGNLFAGFASVRNDGAAKIFFSSNTTQRLESGSKLSSVLAFWAWPKSVLPPSLCDMIFVLIENSSSSQFNGSGL